MFFLTDAHYAVCLYRPLQFFFLACTHQLPASLKVTTSSETLPQIPAKQKINNKCDNLLLCLPACRHNNHQPILNRGGVACTRCVPALSSLCIFWMKQQVKHLPACFALRSSPLWLCKWKGIWLEALHSGSHSVPHRECLSDKWGLFAERGGQSSGAWWRGEQDRRRQRAAFSPSESFIREILQHQAAWMD